MVPVIMITGHSTMRRVGEARDVGVTEFLSKPVTARGVIERITRVVDHPRPFVQTDRSTSAPTGAAATTRAIRAPIGAGPTSHRQRPTTEAVALTPPWRRRRGPGGRGAGRGGAWAGCSGSG